MNESTSSITTELPIQVLQRPVGSSADWQDLDGGPGLISLPPGSEFSIRVKSIDNRALAGLVKEIGEMSGLVSLNLSENRNVTNDGVKHLRRLTQLAGLNLSSCTITNAGIEHLRALNRLSYLNLAYCNHLNDLTLKKLEAMKNLIYVDLQGCLSITTAGLVRVRRKNLTIFRG